VITDPMEGSDGAIREAKAQAARREDGVFYADQYGNPANWRAHYRTTGVEILEQTAGQVTHFVAGLGTTGTLVGVGRKLRETKPGVRLVAAQPDSPLHAIEGWKYLPTALVPEIYDPTLADEHEVVSTEAAYHMVRRLAREEGLFVSPSAGAACVAACRVAERIAAGTIVVLFADGGEKHLHERLLAEGA
jgi:cysteine synthase B